MLPRGCPFASPPCPKSVPGLVPWVCRVADSCAGRGDPTASATASTQTTLPEKVQIAATALDLGVPVPIGPLLCR
eukprot:2987724-Alexandrium_andersonii.AAC.1